MTTRSLPFRTHYLSLAACKHIFLHRSHGLVFVRDAMQCGEAEGYGLSPLLLYALSIPGTAIRRMMFAPLAQPHALYPTVHYVWAREADGFRGRPDALLVSRQVADASPTLGASVARDGVELIVADKGDKISGAALRTAQKDALWLGTFQDSSGRIDTLDRLDETAGQRHRYDVKNHIGKDPQRQQEWSAVPCRPPAAPAAMAAMDWSPGPWLRAWEGDLPPVSPRRYFYNDDRDRKTWLLTGNNPVLEDDAGDDGSAGQDWVGDHDIAMVELAKNLVTCWPNSAAEIARTIGAAARDVKWFVDGKAGLDDDALAELLSVLGIEEWEHGYEASGPCVLIAKAVGAAGRLYSDLSGGGDLAFSFEVVPDSGQPDPSWRYLLFQPCRGQPNVMMFERGSKAADRLSDKTFLGFEGMRQVSAKFYRDVVATAARACQSPPANRREMLGFEERLATYSW